MGDSSQSDGMMAVKSEIEDIYPDIFVHSVQIGDSENKDRIASFYDDLNRQVDEICEQLGSIEELKDGFDAVGFSQGGQILRAYVQRCNSPPVRNLITIGAQHQGVMDLPGCGSDVPMPDSQVSKALQLSEAANGEQECSWWQKMIKKSVYSDIVQNRIVQAQFFKDPARIDEYLKKSLFLADINNERPVKIDDYAEKLGSLENFVMFKFSDDHQVVPKESSVILSQYC
jgi:palmitoyl-protein thioesterase